MAIAPTKWVPASGGVKLATFERGRGPTVVLINGLGASAHDWGATAEKLAERAHVITFDNRGAGQSTILDEPFTLEQMADDSVAVCEAYGIRRAHVVGYSMGGMIAQLLAARRPELIERLVLIATHTGVKSCVPSTPAARAVQARDDLSWPDITRKRYAVYVAPRFFEQQRQTFDRMMAVRLTNLIPEYAWQRQVQAIMQSEREELVRGLRVPTLIVHGREDALIPFGNGEHLRALIPGATFVAIDDCGHMVNWEKPEIVVGAIADFLQL